MKANQAYRNDEEAVSPVIGVILMVAITVVLAAVVFVLVQNLGQTGAEAPKLGLTKDNNEKTLTIIDPDANFGTLTYGPADPDDVWWSGECDIITLSTTGLAPVAADPLAGGDILTTDCTSGETINIVHNQSGKVIYTATFP